MLGGQICQRLSFHTDPCHEYGLYVATIGGNIILDNGLDPLFEAWDSFIKVPHKRRSYRNFKNKVVRFEFCDHPLCIGMMDPSEVP